jgi:hypothetical protein
MRGGNEEADDERGMVLKGDIIWETSILAVPQNHEQGNPGCKSNANMDSPDRHR